MRKKWFSSPFRGSLVLVLLLGLLVPASAALFSIQIGAPPPRFVVPAPPPPGGPVVAVSPVYVDFYAESELHVCGAYFGIDYPVLYSYYHDYGLTPEQVVYVIYVANYCHYPVPYVIGVYKQYYPQGWAVFAAQLGILPGYPIWFRYSQAPTYAVLYVTAGYYGIPYAQLRAMNKNGYPPGEIVAAVNTASKTHTSVNKVLTQRSKGTKWEDIAAQHKTTIEDMKSPPANGKSMKFKGQLEGKEKPQSVKPSAKGATRTAPTSNTKGQGGQNNMGQNSQKNMQPQTTPGNLEKPGAENQTGKGKVPEQVKPQKPDEDNKDQK